MNADFVRVTLVRDIQNGDGSLRYRKDSELLVDPGSAQALILSSFAVRSPTEPA